MDAKFQSKDIEKISLEFMTRNVEVVKSYAASTSPALIPSSKLEVVNHLHIPNSNS